MNHRREMTEKEIYIINQLQLAGYGWRKYATSVLSQGYISDKQSQTLRTMLHKLRSQQADAQYRKARALSSKSYEPDISDLEAMQSGDYF